MSNFSYIEHRSLSSSHFFHVYLSKYNYNTFLQLRLSPKRIPTSGRRGGVLCLEIDKTFQSYLLSGSGDSSLHIYDLENDLNILASIPKGKGHSASITQVQWYPVDAGLFTTSSLDTTLKVWDANTLETACVFRLDEPVHTHAMPFIENTNHCLLAAGLDIPQLRLCDIRSGSSAHTLHGNS